MSKLTYKQVKTLTDAQDTLIGMDGDLYDEFLDNGCKIMETASLLTAIIIKAYKGA